MATETKKILRIESASLGNLANTQIGVLSAADADLGYRAWGGKDGAGTVTLWLAKDQHAQITTLTLTASTTVTTAGILQHDAAGAITGKAVIDALADVNITSVSCAVAADKKARTWSSTDSTTSARSGDPKTTSQ